MNGTLMDAIYIRINPGFQPKTPILSQYFVLRRALFTVKGSVVAERFLRNDNN